MGVIFAVNTRHAKDAERVVVLDTKFLLVLQMHKKNYMYSSRRIGYSRPNPVFLSLMSGTRRYCDEFGARQSTASLGKFIVDTFNLIRFCETLTDQRPLSMALHSVDLTTEQLIDRVALNLAIIYIPSSTPIKTWLRFRSMRMFTRKNTATLRLTPDFDSQCGACQLWCVWGLGIMQLSMPHGLKCDLCIALQ